jgi:tetratricopeptide (TPR) repeat protein
MALARFTRMLLARLAENSRAPRDTVQLAGPMLRTSSVVVMLACASLCAVGSARAQSPAPAAKPTAQDPNDVAALIAEERNECDRLRRRGETSAAEKRLTEILDETPGDAEARTLRALCRFDSADYAAALDDARRALEDALAPGGAPTQTPGGAPGQAPGRAPGQPAVGAASTSTSPAATSSSALRSLCARDLARVLAMTGHAREAAQSLARVERDLALDNDARDAWALGDVLWQAGERKRAKEILGRGTRTPDQQPWSGLLARGLCQRRLGELEAASQSLILADRAASGGRGTGDGTEPDVLAALGDLYFEADREVEAAAHRSAADLYREAQRIDPVHEGAALGLFRLHRYNWQRKSRSAQEILNEFLAARPTSIEGLIAAASADIDDGQLKSARERLTKLAELAPDRREVRTLKAALAWVEHDEAGCEAIVKSLVAEDSDDARPEREIGRALCELYRFAEALPWEKRAVARDEHDWEALTQLGRALANTGDEDAARDALDRADREAGLRQDAWRSNLRLVLKTLAQDYVREKHGELGFTWKPDAAEVLRTYLVPFYSAARTELAQRYGYTPGATMIEVFSRHKDFSVRSTGFEGFPALGVCFGPVVTAVSPLCEMRGTFSWARTSFHEFTHVIHLGLSHNRCPRWITEGLATWEEVNKNPAWTRNMRRELVDAHANGDVIPVRELNRAFRGPRILFGYYQGGLLCQMLIGAHGFPPMIRLLEAFDRGLDLDQALGEVYHTTPEILDRDFNAFVEREIKDLSIEPRWNPARIASLRVGLSQKPPGTSAKKPGEKDARVATEEATRKWSENWCTVAWSAWQTGHKVDAEEALRVIQSIAPQPPRALFLRGEIALAAGDRAKARETWQSAFASGAEDFRARIALGVIDRDANDDEDAEKQFVAAEKDFPGFDEPELSAERNLSTLYLALGRRDDAMRADERWLAYNAGALPEQREVAAWHFEAKRYDASLKYFEQANDIDPFRRDIHRAWGNALRAAEKHEEALREYRVAMLVPPDMDADHPDALTDAESADLLALEAASLAALDRHAEALDTAKRALEKDPDCALAQETLRKLQ